MASPPLDQVLARSMRLPPALAKKNVSALFERRSVNGKILSTSGVENFSLCSSTPSSQSMCDMFSALSHREGSQRTKYRSLCIRDVGVRGISCGAVDLLTYMQAARNLGSWQEAFMAFSRAAGVCYDAESGSLDGCVEDVASLDAHVHTPKSSTLQSDLCCFVHRSGVSDRLSPGADHVKLLMTTCAEADQFRLVEQLARFFCVPLPSVVTHAVQLILDSATKASAIAGECQGEECDFCAVSMHKRNFHTEGSEFAERNKNRSRASQKAEKDVVEYTEPTYVNKNVVIKVGWRRAFNVVRRCASVVGSRVPIEAYNACLRACELDHDWRGALEVIRSMGTNPLCLWRSSEEDRDSCVREDEVCTDAKAESKCISASACSAAYARDEVNVDKMSSAAIVRQNTVDPAAGTEMTLERVAQGNVVGGKGMSFSSLVKDDDVAKSDVVHATARCVSCDAKGASSMSTMNLSNGDESALQPPVPNAVSYAILMATLEQCEMSCLATEVLSRLPRAEQQEIAASYAALILVWSVQAQKAQQHRKVS